MYFETDERLINSVRNYIAIQFSLRSIVSKLLSVHFNGYCNVIYTYYFFPSMFSVFIVNTEKILQQQPGKSRKLDKTSINFNSLQFTLEFGWGSAYFQTFPAQRTKNLLKISKLERDRKLLRQDKRMEDYNLFLLAKADTGTSM